MTYSSEVLADSPLAFWKLDEASGTIADSSGNSKTLTGVNSPTQSASGGPFAGAGCVTLNGTNQRLDSNAAPNSSDYTIEFWYKGTDGQATVASGRAGSSNYTIAVRIGAVPVGSAPAGCVNVGVSGNGTWSGAHTTSAVVNDNVWHHIVCVWDGTAGAGITPSQFAIYIDGVAKTLTQDPYNNPPAPIASSFYKFGDHPEDGPAPLAGALSNIALYTTALTSTRVAAHYAAGSVVEPSGTISAVLPPLSANLSGGIAFSGTIAAVLPGLGANLSGTSVPPGVAGTMSATLPPLGGSLVGAYSDTATLAAILPPLSADLSGAYAPPPVTGTLAATLPALSASIDGQAFEPGVGGFLAAILPALSAALVGDVLGRNGLGLVLDSSAVLTVDDVLEPEPTVPAGTPSTVLHIVAPTVPVPTLVAGRPQ